MFVKGADPLYMVTSSLTDWKGLMEKDIQILKSLQQSKIY